MNGVNGLLLALPVIVGLTTCSPAGAAAEVVPVKGMLPELEPGGRFKTLPIALYETPVRASGTMLVVVRFWEPTPAELMRANPRLPVPPLITVEFIGE